MGYLWCVVLLVAACAAPFGSLALGVWGLSPVFAREAQAEASRHLPTAQVVTGRWRRRRAGPAPLTWRERARVTVGLAAIGVVVELVRELSSW